MSTNSFITIKEIARETLPRLMDALVFPNLVYRDYSEAYSNLGDTIQVRRPVMLEAKEFDASSGVTAQNLTENSVPVKLDKIATVDIELTAIEGATNIYDLTEQFLEPAAAALAQKINSDGLELYKDIPYYAGTAGTTPDGLDDIVAMRRILNGNRAPSDMRFAVWDTEADSKLIQIPAVLNAEKSGSTRALREGSLGRIMGMEHYTSQAVKKHTGGTASGTLLTDGATSAGATVIHIDGASEAAATMKKGDLLTISGVQYVVTEDVTFASNEGDVKVYPAVPANIADGTAVSYVASHTANLAFHRNAFAFVCRPLVQPSGVESYITSYNGISLRVVRGYDMKYKKETLSMDVLYGFKTVYPELACRCLG